MMMAKAIQASDSTIKIGKKFHQIQNILYIAPIRMCNVAWMMGMDWHPWALVYFMVTTIPAYEDVYLLDGSDPVNKCDSYSPRYPLVFKQFKIK